MLFLNAAAHRSDGSNTNENWAVTASAIQSLQNTSQCLATADTGFVGTAVTTATCDASDPSQALVYSATTGLIIHTPTGLCVDAGTPIVYCTEPSRANWTICDTSAPIEARAADIVARMSLADKINALGTGTPSLPSVGLPAYNW